MNSLNQIYISKVGLTSNKFDISIKKQGEIEIVKDGLKAISENNWSGLELKLEQDGTKTYHITLSFNPQFFYNHNKYSYDKILKPTKFSKYINEIQETINRIGIKKLKPIITWELDRIEISKDIDLKGYYYNYADVIKAINTKKQGSYPNIVDCDNGTTIYFTKNSEKYPISYITHVRFENKIKRAKSYKRFDEKFQEEEENILQCTLMLNTYKINPTKINYIPITPDFYKYFDKDYEKELITMKDIIEDYENNLPRCGKFFIDILGKYIIYENLELNLHAKFKNDTKLLDKIINDKNITQGNEKHILYYIIIKLLYQLSDYKLNPFTNFLKDYTNNRINEIQEDIIKKIKNYRDNYRKNFKVSLPEDLYKEIKNKLIPNI